jgi:hypothetical protein
MHDQRHRGKVVPIRAVHFLPARHLGCTRFHQGMHLLGLGTAWRRRLALAKRFLSLAKGLSRLSETTANGPCIALDQLMDAVKQIRDTPAL